MAPEAAVWWLRLALGDLAAANVLVDAPAIAPRFAAYHAQQATEKALKAVIALDGIEPPFTHDLVYLLEICPADAGLHGVVAEIERLAKPHSAARYPAIDGTAFDQDEVEALVRDASLLVAAVQGHFHERGIRGTELAPV